MRHFDNTVLFSRVPQPDPGEPESLSLRAWVAKHLCDDLANPVQVRHFPNRLEVTAMRGIEVFVDWRQCSLRVRGRLDPTGEWVSGSLDLHRPLTGGAWAQAWWLASLPRIPDALQQEAKAFPLAQASDLILAEARRSGLLPEARRRLIRALQLDPQLLRLAAAFRPGMACDSSFYSFVWCSQNLDAAVRENAESSLWPLFGVAYASNRIYPDEHAGALRKLLVDKGLSHKGWALLCRLGGPLWLPLRHCHEFQRTPISTIVAWTNLVTASGRRDLPPQALTLGFGRMFSMASKSLEANRDLARIVRLAWGEMDGLDASGRTVFARGPFETVLCWWHARGRPTPLPRKIGWRWLERRARCEILPESGTDAPWPTFGDQRRIHGFLVVPLTSLHAVRRAGIALHNCLSNATQSKTRDATEALYLIRNEEGRAVAMFSASEGQSGTLESRSVRGRYNQHGDQTLQNLADLYLRSIGQVD